MIESIALLGHLRNQKCSDDICKMIQNVYRNKAKGWQRLAEINFVITEDGSPVYDEVIVEDLRPEHSKKILYRGGYGNDINPSPSAVQTDKDTFSKKIVKFFERATVLETLTSIKGDNIVTTNLTDEKKQWLNALYTNLQENQQEIRTQLKPTISQKKKDDSLILTITFTKGEQKLFLEEVPLFVKLFKHFCTPKKVFKGTCSICGRENVNVTFASSNMTYKFFNVDKDGFFWNMINDKSYTAFPICLDCLRDIEQGKEYIANNLNFRFVEGLFYQLIPQFFTTNDERSVKKFIRAVKNESTQTKDLFKTIRQEERVLKNLSELDDTVAVNLLFLDSSSGAAAEKISTLIQDVYPSRLKTIYNAKFAVDDMYREVFPTSQPKDGFSFMVVRNFFPRGERKEDEDKNKKEQSDDKKKKSDDYFLRVTQDIFEDKLLSNDFIYRFIMKKVIEEFYKMLAKREEHFISTIKEAEMLVSFLLELNLLKSEKTCYEKSIG